MTDIWKRIADKTNEHGYMSGVDRESDRVKATGEVYTPTDVTIDMMKLALKSNPDVFAPGKTVIDPACGDGQLLVPVKWYKVFHHGMSEEDAVKDLYGVDIMEDNVELCKRRLGGGNIYCDDCLNPQTKEVRSWFGEVNIDDFF